MKYLVLVAALATSPAWAIYKCTVDGKTSFQEQPCERGAQTSIKPAYEPPPPAAAARPSIAEQSAAMEKERIARDIAYELRDKQNYLYAYRRSCEREVREIASGATGFNDNLAGAMRGQAVAMQANAHATNCGTNAAAIESEIEDLRRRCVAAGCTPLVR